MIKIIYILLIAIFAFWLFYPLPKPYNICDEKLVTKEVLEYCKPYLQTKFKDCYLKTRGTEACPDIIPE